MQNVRDISERSCGKSELKTENGASAWAGDVTAPQATADVSSSLFCCSCTTVTPNQTFLSKVQVRSVSEPKQKRTVQMMPY